MRTRWHGSRSVSEPACWLAAFSREPCDGRLEQAHLVPKQIIRREVWNRVHHAKEPDEALAPRLPPTARDLLWDERTWVPACYRHHTMLDVARTLTVPRGALPPGLTEFCAEFGLTWWLDREYGL